MNNALKTLDLHTKKLILRGLKKRADFIDSVGRPILSAVVGEDAQPELTQRFRNYVDYTGQGQLSSIPGLLKLVNSLDNMGGLSGENPGGQKYDAYQHMFYGNNELYKMYNDQQGHMLSESGGITPATMYGLINDLANTKSPRGRALVKHLMTPQGQRTREDLMAIMNQYKPLMNPTERASLDQTATMLKKLHTDNPQYNNQIKYREGWNGYVDQYNDKGLLSTAGTAANDLCTALYTGKDVLWNNAVNFFHPAANAKNDELPFELTPARADLAARSGYADTVHATLSEKLQPILNTMGNSAALNYRYPWARAAVQQGEDAKWGNNTQERRAYMDKNFKKPPAMANPGALIDPKYGLGSALRTAIPGLGMGLPLALMSGASGGGALLLPLLASAGLGCYGYGRHKGQFGSAEDWINPIVDSLTNGFWNLPQMLGFGGQPQDEGTTVPSTPAALPSAPTAPTDSAAMQPQYQNQPEYKPYNLDTYRNQPQYAYQQPASYTPTTTQQPTPYTPSAPQQPVPGYSTNMPDTQQYASNTSNTQQNTQYIS